MLVSVNYVSAETSTVSETNVKVLGTENLIPTLYSDSLEKPTLIEAEAKRKELLKEEFRSYKKDVVESTEKNVLKLREKAADVRVRLDKQLGEVKEESDIKRGLRSTTSEEREPLKAELREKQIELKKEAELRKEEKRKEIIEKRNERIKAYTERIVKRYNIALDRIEKLGNRIDSRIEKFEEKGIDVTEVRILKAIAEDQILIARENINNIKTAMEKALEAENPKEAFEIVRQMMSDAKSSIKDAHLSLVEMIKALKGALENQPEGEKEGEEKETEE
jgi:hypothetical protein